MENYRNRNLNAAYLPQWEEPEGAPQIIPGVHGDTNFDPFAGTGWGDWLDTMGAGDPGGVKMAGGRGLPNSPVSPSIEALRAMGSPQGTPQMDEGYVGDPNKPGRRQADADVARLYPSWVEQTGNLPVGAKSVGALKKLKEGR